MRFGSLISIKSNNDFSVVRNSMCCVTKQNNRLHNPEINELQLYSIIITSVKCLINTSVVEIS